MKLGILAQYLDSRNDIRQLIELLAQRHEVSLFLRKSDLKLGENVANVQVRPIPSPRKTMATRIAKRLYSTCAVLPRSRNNYYIMERIKLLNTLGSRAQLLEKRLLLAASKFAPKVISYDAYLGRVGCAQPPDIDDIDAFLCFTEIYDDAFFAELLRAGKRVFVYVYSWDHPCKMVRFSRGDVNYLVWNDGIKQDLVELQHIDPCRVQVLGSSQLSYIDEFQQQGDDESAKPFPFDYVYYGCAIGTPQLARREAELIRQLAAAMNACTPNVKLVVRPYPFLKSWDVYEGLRSEANVVMDDQYREGAATMALPKQRIFDKFDRIRHAKAFVHLGTTMGMEAAFFDTPVLQIDFTTDGAKPGKLGLYDFIHQYQNDRYLMLRQYPNVIASVPDFANKLRRLLTEPAPFLEYNRSIARQTPLMSFEQLTERLSDLMVDATARVPAHA